MEETINTTSSETTTSERREKLEDDYNWTQTNDNTINSPPISKSFSAIECNVCHLGTETEKSVTCSMCNTPIHFHCTRLPPYTLYVLSTLPRKYVCEVCAEVPETFLFNLIPSGTFINNEGEEEEGEEEEEEEETNDKSIPLETKVNNLCELVEKYDIPSIEDKIQDVYSNLEKINNNLCENLAAVERKTSTSTDGDVEKDVIEERLNATVQELTTLRAAEAVLLESLREKDKFISSLSEDKFRHIKIMDEMNKNIQSLQHKISNFKYETTSTQLEELLQDKKRLNERIRELKQKCSEKEYKINSWSQDAESKQKIINIITAQLSETNERNKGLETNLALALEKMNSSDKQTESPTDNSKPNDVDGCDKKPKIVLFHDILCKNVNETILSNEGVTTTKILAPTFSTILEKLEDIKKADTIVLQCLTGSVKDMTVEDLVKLTSETVDKCLSKANKVMISSIIKREDDETVCAKVDLFNASIRYKFLNNANVLICNNDNLNDRRYRLKDGVNLTPHGISLFATNLKYKMAESLGITVVKKRKEISNRLVRRNVRFNPRLAN